MAILTNNTRSCIILSVHIAKIMKKAYSHPSSNILDVSTEFSVWQEITHAGEEGNWQTAVHRVRYLTQWYII